MGSKGSKQVKCPKGCIPIPQQQRQMGCGMPMFRPQMPMMQQQCPMPMQVKSICHRDYFKIHQYFISLIH